MNVISNLYSYKPCHNLTIVTSDRYFPYDMKYVHPFNISVTIDNVHVIIVNTHCE